MATEKTYKHAVFSIADPLVKRHIEQALFACKFRIRFPAFYQFLVETRIVIKNQLLISVEEKYKIYKPEIADEELEHHVEVILEERRLLDNANGFIQTGNLLLPDIFLVSNKIMTIEEIRELFYEVSVGFWNAVETILYPDSGALLREKILSYLNENGFYLPNLFPQLNIEDLFFNFLPIHLSYSKFNSSKDPQNLSGLPSTKECNEILKPLFSHASPLYFDSSSYLDYSVKINQKFTSTHFVLQMSLNENPENLPFILRDFLIGYQSRRLDFMRCGTNNEYDVADIDEINNLTAVANEVLSILDKFSNQRIGNRKEIYSLGYDAVLNAILALFFINYHCNLIFEDRDLTLIDLQDTVSLVNGTSGERQKDDHLNNEYFHGEHLDFGKSYESFINKLEKVFQDLEEFQVSISPPNRGKRKISNIQITLKESISPSLKSSKKSRPQTINLNISSLKKTIREFLKKRVPEVEKFMWF